MKGVEIKMEMKNTLIMISFEIIIIALVLALFGITQNQLNEFKEQQIKFNTDVADYVKQDAEFKQQYSEIETQELQSIQNQEQSIGNLKALILQQFMIDNNYSIELQELEFNSSIINEIFSSKGKIFWIKDIGETDYSLIMKNSTENCVIKFHPNYIRCYENGESTTCNENFCGGE